MQADANSANDDHARPRQPMGARSLDRERMGFSQPSKLLFEHSTSVSQRDTPPSAPSTSSMTANTQTVQLPHGEWLDTVEDKLSPLDLFFQRAAKQMRRTLSDQVTPVRLASHISVLMVAAIILIVSRIDVPNWNVSLRLFPNSTLLGTEPGARARGQLSALIGSTELAATNNESLHRATVPFTVINEEDVVIEGVQTYTVQPGDTVLGIAQKFGLQPETIQWSNPGIEINADLIRPGDQLNILPTNGVLHTVASGDTLSVLASRYKVTIQDILDYPANGLLDPATPLVIGSQLVIPNGTKPFATQQVFAYSGGSVPASAKVGSGTFAWPTSGAINQDYWGGHRAVDIGAWTGSPVKAADGGYVAIATGGWNGGYGNHVIIDHGNGFVTLYAHLNSIYVRSGENVARGQQVGSVGNTGNSTGPHLHFEIRYQGAQQNPVGYLP